jgi:hypothetical protein
LTNKFYFNERSYTIATVAEQQFYNLPPQCKQLINLTVLIGSVLWPTAICPSRDFWDKLNVITFYQDFPSFMYVYNGQVGIFPIPASSGNTITMNYKIRDTDLSQPDYTTGTVSITNGTPNLTFSGSTLVANMANRFIQIPAPTGDNQWYQILSVNTGAGTAVLYNNYTGPTVSGGIFTIGEMPILAEEYQDLAIYRALKIYYSSIVPNTSMAALYDGLYTTGYEMLNNEYGQKTPNVVLTDLDAPIFNPNIFQSNITQM